MGGQDASTDASTTTNTTNTTNLSGDIGLTGNAALELASILDQGATIRTKLDRDFVAQLAASTPILNGGALSQSFPATQIPKQVTSEQAGFLNATTGTLAAGAAIATLILLVGRRN